MVLLTNEVEMDMIVLGVETGNDKGKVVTRVEGCKCSRL